MALVLKDRVRETSTTTGAGTITLNGAVLGHQSFSSAIGSGNTCYYTIANTSANEWEVGIGTVGSGVLIRDEVLDSSNAGALVDFSSGLKDVFVTYPAGKQLSEGSNISLMVNDAGYSSVAIGTLPPPDPDAGDLWWNSETGALFIYYDDGDNEQWVQSSVPLLSGVTPPPPPLPTLNLRDISTSQEGSTTSNHTVDLPTYEADDLVVIVFRAGSTTSASIASGWDEEISRDNNGITYIWSRVMVGTEGSSVTVTTPSTIRSASIAFSVENVQFGVEGLFESSNVNDPPEVTASWGVESSLFVAIMTNRRSDSDVTAAPSTYTDFTTISQSSSSQTSRSRVSVGFKFATTDTEDPGAFTTSGTIDNPHSATLVIR